MSHPSSHWPTSSAPSRASAYPASSWSWQASNADRSAASNQPWRAGPVVSQPPPSLAPAAQQPAQQLARPPLRNADEKQIPMWKQRRMARGSASSAAADASPAAAAAASADASSSGTLIAAYTASSAMLRLLGVDSGAQFSLCELLSLPEIAGLHSSCRSWRHWINTAQRVEWPSVSCEAWRHPAEFPPMRVGQDVLAVRPLRATRHSRARSGRRSESVFAQDPLLVG